MSISDTLEIIKDTSIDCSLELRTILDAIHDSQRKKEFINSKGIDIIIERLKADISSDNINMCVRIFMEIGHNPEIDVPNRVLFLLSSSFSRQIAFAIAYLEEISSDNPCLNTLIDSSIIELLFHIISDPTSNFQIDAYWIISNLSLNERVQTLIVKNGGVELLIGQLLILDEEKIEPIVYIIQNISSLNSCVCEIMVHQGIVPILVTLLQKKESFQLQESIACTLMNLAYDVDVEKTTSKQAIMESGALSLLLKNLCLISDLSQNAIMNDIEEVNEEGEDLKDLGLAYLNAIKNMAVYHPARAIITENTAYVKCLSRIIQSCVCEQWKVASAACIWNMSLDSKVCEILAQCGCIEILLDYIQSYGCCGGGICEVLAALVNITQERHILMKAEQLQIKDHVLNLINGPSISHIQFRLVAQILRNVLCSTNTSNKFCLSPCQVSNLLRHFQQHQHPLNFIISNSLLDIYLLLSTDETQLSLLLDNSINGDGVHGVLMFLSKIISLDDDNMVIKAGTILMRCSRRLAYKSKIIDLGIIPNLIKMLTQSTKQQEIASRILGSISRDIGGSRQVIAHGCTDPLLHLLNSPEEIVQDMAVFALGRLTYDIAHCPELARKGLIPIFVDMMTCGRPTTVEVVTVGLENFSSCEPCIESLFEAGGVKSLILAVQHGTDLTREAAAGALGNLARDAKLKIVIAEGGAILPLVSALRTQNCHLKASAASALWNLALLPNLRSSIASAGAIPLLVDMLMTSTLTNSQEVVVGALWSMSCDDLSSYASCSEDIIAGLKKVLSTDGSTSTLEMSVRFIGRLAKSEEFRGSTSTCQLIPYIVKLLESGNVSIHVLVSKALASLARNRKCASAIVESHGLQLLIDFLKEGQSINQNIAIFALGRLTHDLHNVIYMVNSGMIPILNHISFQGSIIERECAITTLQNIYNHQPECSSKI